MVDGPAWRGDDHMHPSMELLELPTDGLSAEDRKHLHAQLAAVLEHRLAHLHGQLARGHDHERRRHGRCVATDRLEDRQRERGGLPGASGRLSEHIGARDQQRDRLALDRCGLLVPEASERLQELIPEPQPREPELGVTAPVIPAIAGARVVRIGRRLCHGAILPGISA